MWLGSGITVTEYRPAAAALIQPLAWELPNATGTALKRRKRKEKTEEQYLL